ncbi:MAG: Yip1 family protein [Deltaproteobacteria bacterium]|nr:Yip1 family protein [Deltaproteobacteria bacterium]
MNETSTKRRFTFEIDQFEGEDTRARVKRILLWTFPEQSREAVERLLSRRPARFSGVMTADNADRLRRQIQDIGARAELIDLPAAPASGVPVEPVPAPVAPPPVQPMAPPPSEPVEQASAPENPSPEPQQIPSLAALRATIARDRLDLSGEDLREAERLAAARAAEDQEGPSPFFWTAWAQALFSPRKFFASLHAPGGAFQALLFAAVLGLLAGVLSFPARMLAGLENGTVERPDLAERYLTMVFSQPFAAVVATCVSAWLIHLGIRFLAGPRPFEVTLKVVAYTSAAAVFAAIPKAGESIAAFVVFLLTLVGLSSAQRISPIKALGAVFFPLLLLGFVLAMTLGGIAVGSFIILEALRG